jgi:hypothetical protein
MNSQKSHGYDMEGFMIGVARHRIIGCWHFGPGLFVIPPIHILATTDAICLVEPKRFADGAIAIATIKN